MRSWKEIVLVSKLKENKFLLLMLKTSARREKYLSEIMFNKFMKSGRKKSKIMNSEMLSMKKFRICSKK